jgi:hypothetical protein
MTTSQPAPVRASLCAPFRRALAVVLRALAAVPLILLVGGAAHAQGGVPLVTVATDQSSLNLSNQFGIPVSTAINQNGDFAFVGSGETALFWRPAGASSATRLLQIYDEAPGFPGSQIESFTPELSINASHTLLFGLRFVGADHLGHSALLTFNGASYQTLVTSDQVAPGSNGATYGLEIFPGSIDDSGDINFAAATVSSGAVSSVLYILPAGRTAAFRIVGTSDTPLATCTWCVAPANPLGGFLPGVPVGSAVVVGTPGVSSFPALNARGQMLISLWGGLFIGSKDGSFTLVPMAASGACSPQALTKTNPTFSVGTTAFLNNAGAVAFSNPPDLGSAAICVAPPAEPGAPPPPPTPVVSSGDPAPSGIGGGTTLSPVALGFDDSGDIVYDSAISGSNITIFALLRHRSSTPQPDVVAYNCEPAPGSSGNVFATSSNGCGGGWIFVTTPFSIFSSVSIANGGSVSFDVLLSNGQSAIYRQTGADPPEFVSVEVAGSVTLAGGVRISFSNLLYLNLGQTEILNNGSVFFASYLATGPADFAVNLATPGNVQPLMSTADTLPSGAVALLGSTPPRAAGHFVAFTAQPAAGRTNLLEADLSSGAITRVASDNDPAFAPAGNRILTSDFFLNENGQIALESSSTNFSLGVGSVSLGTPVNTAWLSFTTGPCGTIYLWSPVGGLAKVAAPGDTASGSTAQFTCLTLNDGFPSPLNGAGQVAFTSAPTIDGFSPCLLCSLPPAVAGIDGVFLYTPGGSASEIVGVNDTLPGETQPSGLVPDLSVPVNSSGQVAFGAQVGASSQGQGFFLRQAGGALQKVMTYGDPIPASSDTFGFPHFISGLTDSGNIAFSATTSSAIDGLFFAPAAGPIETVAVDGGPAPGGGTFSLSQQIATITSLPPTVGNLAAMNSESDIAFGATLTGGAANSGYFRAMHSGSGVGALQAVAVEGQTAPGWGTFSTIPIGYNSSADFALGPDGALAFANLVTSGSELKDGMFVARPDGTLLKVAESGDSLPGGGVASGILLSPKLAAGDAGKFAFLASIQGGSARRGIFVTAILAGTAATTAALSPLQNPAVAQQPVMLTATVTSTTPGSPTGTVAFFANGISLGSAPLSGGGQATLTTSSLTAGSDSLVAQYDGDTKFASDDSAPMAIVAAGFAPATSQLAVKAGQSLVIPLTIFAPAGANMNFTVSCSGLPASSSCAFDMNPVAPAATGTAVKLTLSTMAGSRMPAPAPRNGFPELPGMGLAAALAALFAIAAAVAPGRAARLRVASCSCLAMLALAVLLSGCGAITSSAPTIPGTPTGAASFIVTGTSGAITITTTVKVTVQ